MKTSYVHVQTPFGRSLGFSAKLERDPDVMPHTRDDKGNTLCNLSITFCNKKDKHFDKKVARAELANKEPQLVRVRDVPNLLALAETRATGMWMGDANRYNYVLRRFV